MTALLPLVTCSEVTRIAWRLALLRVAIVSLCPRKRNPTESRDPITGRHSIHRRIPLSHWPERRKIPRSNRTLGAKQVLLVFPCDSRYHRGPHRRRTDSGQSSPPAPVWHKLHDGIAGFRPIESAGPNIPLRLPLEDLKYRETIGRGLAISYVLASSMESASGSHLPKKYLNPWTPSSQLFLLSFFPPSSLKNINTHPLHPTASSSSSQLLKFSNTLV